MPCRAGATFGTPDTRHPTPDTRHPTPDTRHPTPDTRHRISLRFPRPSLRRHWLAVAATVLIVVAQLLPVAAISDPLGAPLPPGWRLYTPLAYALLAPLFTLWDHVAMLSLSRLVGFLVGCQLAYLTWRIVVRRRARVRWLRALLEEGRALILSLAALAAFIGIGVAWNARPMVRLVGLSVDEMTVEPHSHTNASHDVQGWPVDRFTVEASHGWHQRAGVDVLFVTDHNLAPEWSAADGAMDLGETQLCPGVEVSAHGAHVVVLGTPLPGDHRPYRGSPANRARLFAEVGAAPSAVAIASIPEYRGQVAEFVAEGVQGFEIVNASPKANELPRVERDSVMAVATGRHLALVAAGDQHGYGATAMAWNVMPMAGWRRASGSPCGAIVARLRTAGPTAVRIVERTRLRPDHPLPTVLTPLGVVGMAWATMSPTSAAGWLAWIWVIALARGVARDTLRRRRTRAIMSTVARHR